MFLIIPGNQLRFSTRWGECNYGERWRHDQLLAHTESQHSWLGEIHLQPFKRQPEDGGGPRSKRWVG